MRVITQKDNQYRSPLHQLFSLSITLVLLCLFLFLPEPGFGQELQAPEPLGGQEKEQEPTYIEDYDPPPKSILKTSFPAMLISQNPLTGEFRLGYEAASAPQQSTFISVSLLYPNIFGKAAMQSVEDSVNGYLQRNYSNPKDLKLMMIGYRVQLAQKFYTAPSPLKRAPEGFYFGPMVSFAETKIFFQGAPDQFVKMTYFSANLMVGYQFILKDDITFDVSTGLRYRHNYYNYSNTDKKVDKTIPGFIPGNKQKGFYFMNQFHVGLGLTF